MICWGTRQQTAYDTALASAHATNTPHGSFQKLASMYTAALYIVQPATLPGYSCAAIVCHSVSSEYLFQSLSPSAGHLAFIDDVCDDSC